MKKLLLYMLVFAMSLALFACGGTSDETTGGNADPDHVHTWEEIVELEATCTTPGKKIIKCACGEVQGEEELPVGAHNATMASCTEDAVCTVCGTVLAEKYGHTLSGGIVTKATCTTEGIESGVCQVCNTTVEKTLPVDPENHTLAFSFSGGNVATACTECNYSKNFEEKIFVNLSFDNTDELNDYPEFGFVPNSEKIAFKDGGMQVFDTYSVKYDSQITSEAQMLFAAFDFVLTETGKADGGESIFTFMPTKDGKALFRWAFKYYASEGVLSTATKDFDSSNSIKAEVGKKYSCAIIVDGASGKMNVYIDGMSIGSPSHKFNYQEVSNDKYGFRFFEGNGALSKPVFDNFKFVEIK